MVTEIRGVLDVLPGFVYTESDGSMASCIYERKDGSWLRDDLAQMSVLEVRESLLDAYEAGYDVTRLEVGRPESETQRWNGEVWV